MSVTRYPVGNVGIGTNSPAALLEVSGDGNLVNAHTRLVNFNNTNNNGVYLTIDRARGTQDSPSALQGGDEILKIIARGRDASNQWIEAAAVFFESDGTPGTGDMPGRIIFLTTADGNSIAAERMRIIESGNVGIGLTAPTSKLHIDQASATGAIPVLTLDQGDTSEEMMELLCTIGTGNAIEAIGAKTLTTTHFIKVTITGGLTRYIPVGTIA